MNNDRMGWVREQCNNVLNGGGGGGGGGVDLRVELFECLQAMTPVNESELAGVLLITLFFH